MLVTIKDEEELFIVSTMQDIVLQDKSLRYVYLVGGWMRAKLLKAYTYDFEFLCHEADFSKLTERMIDRLGGKPPSSPFLKCRFVKSERNPANANNSRPLFILTLLSKENRKYKLSLKTLHENSMESDKTTRDFTINSIYCDVKRREVFDPAGGIADFEAKRLRTVGSVAATFKHNIHLFFRLLEFSVRYSLKIDPKIQAYLNLEIDPFTGIFCHYKNTNSANLTACVKKFFCKHYLGEMILLAVKINFITFFRLSFINKELFNGIYLRVGVLMKQLEHSYETKAALLKGLYKDKVPKDFYFKGRMFLVAFVFFPHDENYATEFLNTFLFITKSNAAKQSLKLIKDLYQLICEAAEKRLSVAALSRIAAEKVSQEKLDTSQCALSLIAELIYAQQISESGDQEKRIEKENQTLN